MPFAANHNNNVPAAQTALLSLAVLLLRLVLDALGALEWVFKYNLRASLSASNAAHDCHHCTIGVCLVELHGHNSPPNQTFDSLKV